MRSLFVSSLLCLTLAGCSQTASYSSSPALTGTLYDYRIESASGEPYSLEKLATALESADVILVGEWHSHSGVHLFQAALLAELASITPNMALSMEQFARPDQAVINQYLAGDIGENSLLSQTHRWSNYNSSYRPLVEFAKENGLPIIASNAPADTVRCIAAEGKDYLDRLPEDKRQFVAATLHDDESPYKEKFFAAMFHGDEAKTENQYLAQLAWDDTMAESIVDFLKQHPNDKVMHIAGAFHVENGLGIARRIHLLNPDLNIAIISPQTEDEPLSQAVDDYRLIVKPLPPQWLTDEEMEQAMAGMRHGDHTPPCD
ncbi:ChaN family lipoprotein [Enterovibrio sp. ZSDZ35]|uniref:ChaN family lipoprotein n=1 Tax=Enterovibrio qingdaonensis TaxID=2899818 RepID=A0ABT5QK99_9GAMM|nr:ChaN family lipoprotein [Enterovibrio sp. ZSDZ35]MDD1781420.1 ChaN family lipoprotein [Enterovibrio sp. ZSDZ35]